MGFLDQAGKKFAEVQKKTGDTIAVYKLQGQIKNIENDIQRIYAAIGEICYTTCKAGRSPEGLDVLYENIDNLMAAKVELNREIDRLNHVARCPGCGGAVTAGLKFCPGCGNKLHDAAATNEDTTNEQ